MFSTTQEIFYAVAAGCCLIVSVFLCYALYYFSQVMKNSNDVVLDVKDRIERASSIFEFIKSKAISLGVKGAMALMDKMKDKKKK